MTTIALSDPRLPVPPATRPRVLFLLEEYPQAGQTHIRSEIEALAPDYEIGIVALRAARQTYADYRPHRIVGSLTDIIAAVRAFAPDLLHAHHLTQLGLVAEVSRISGIPFTLRAQAADTLMLRPRGLGEKFRQWLRGRQPLARATAVPGDLRAINDELCLGVLILPFARRWLTRAGVCEAKLIDCFPVVSFSRFHDRETNGDAVMSIGMPAPGRALPDVLRLARKVPGRSFNLYTLGGETSALEGVPQGGTRRQADSGGSITCIGPVEPAEMPREYKKHRWLVLTGDGPAPLIGWPMAIAEAQAAGVGVCIPALRPDLAHYVGEGAGILYESIDELPAIISAPVPEEMRERGFEQARKSDIERHKHLLTDLWADALRNRAAEFRPAPLAGAVPAASAPGAAAVLATSA